LTLTSAFVWPLDIDYGPFNNKNVLIIGPQYLPSCKYQHDTCHVVGLITAIKISMRDKYVV